MKHALDAALLCGALALSGCGQQAAPQNVPQLAPQLTPLISRDRPRPQSGGDAITRANFGSLELAQAGGFIDVQFQMYLSDKVVQLHPGPRGEKIKMLRARLWPQELQSLIKVLNGARFTRIVGNYENPSAADAISRTVILSLRQPGQAKSRAYTISDNVGRAPKGFDKVTTWLSDLRGRKFPHAKQH